MKDAISRSGKIKDIVSSIDELRGSIRLKEKGEEVTSSTAIDENGIMTSLSDLQKKIDLLQSSIDSKADASSLVSLVSSYQLQARLETLQREMNAKLSSLSFTTSSNVAHPTPSSLPYSSSKSIPAELLVATAVKTSSSSSLSSSTGVGSGGGPVSGSTMPSSSNSSSSNLPPRVRSNSLAIVSSGALARKGSFARSESTA